MEYVLIINNETCIFWETALKNMYGKMTQYLIELNWIYTVYDSHTHNQSIHVKWKETQTATN